MHRLQDSSDAKKSFGTYMTTAKRTLRGFEKREFALSALLVILSISSCHTALSLINNPPPFLTVHMYQCAAHHLDAGLSRTHCRRQGCMHTLHGGSQPAGGTDVTASAVQPQRLRRTSALLAVCMFASLFQAMVWPREALLQCKFMLARAAQRTESDCPARRWTMLDTTDFTALQAQLSIHLMLALSSATSGGER